MSPSSRLSFACVLACAMLSPACAGRVRHPPVTQAALRGEFDRHTCARWETAVNQWSLLLFDATCEPAPPSSAVGPLVRACVARLRRLLILAEAAYSRFYEHTSTPPAPPAAEAQRLADAAVWSDPLFSGAIWRVVRVELAARGLTCSDCPPATEPPLVTVTWAEFFPYLAAHVWPAQPAEGAPVEIYTCSGINGAADLPVNPTLLQAGQLAAVAFAEDETTSRQIRDLAGTRSLTEVSRSLRSYLDAPASREFACAALADVAWFTGLRVTDCAPPTVRSLSVALVAEHT